MREKLLDLSELLTLIRETQRGFFCAAVVVEKEVGKFLVYGPTEDTLDPRGAKSIRSQIREARLLHKEKKVLVFGPRGKICPECMETETEAELCVHCAKRRLWARRRRQTQEVSHV